MATNDKNISVYLFLRTTDGFPSRFQILSTNEPSCALRILKDKIPDSYIGPFLSMVGSSLEDAETKMKKAFKEGKLDDYEIMIHCDNGSELIYRVGNLRSKRKLRIKSF